MNLGLIKKLLTKSSNEACTAEESAAFFAKAKAMADEHGLDLAILAAQVGEEQQKEEMTEQEINLGKRFSVVHKFLIHLVEEHFRVLAIYQGGRYVGRRMAFLGRKSDVEFGLFAYFFLTEEFNRRWKQYQRENGVGVNARNAYMYGMKQGLDAKLRVAAQSQEAEKLAVVPQDVKSRYTLAVVSEKEARGKYLTTKYPRLGTYKSSAIQGLGRADVMQDGRQTGAQISIARPLTAA